jgi:hypothetical protein
MYDMRFLFDKETDACVDQIYIDTQLERTRARNKEKALLKSGELFKRITDGVYRRCQSAWKGSCASAVSI